MRVVRAPNLGRFNQAQLGIGACALAVAAWAAWHWGSHLPHKSFLNEWMPNIGADFAFVGLALLVLDTASRHRERTRRRPQIEQALWRTASSLLVLSFCLPQGIVDERAAGESFEDLFARWRDSLSAKPAWAFSSLALSRIETWTANAATSLDRVEERYGRVIDDPEFSVAIESLHHTSVHVVGALPQLRTAFEASEGDYGEDVYTNQVLGVLEALADDALGLARAFRRVAAEHDMAELGMARRSRPSI